MISIENRTLFSKAEAKARQVKPRVWPLTFGTYMVEGQSNDYRVRFSKDNGGHWQAECDCPAHSKGTPKPCYHIPASYTAMKIQIGIIQQVRAAKAALVPSVSDWMTSQEAA